MNTRKLSGVQEKAIAKAVGGQVQINSGATPFYKGDVKTTSFLIEAKTCARPQDSFSIREEWLIDIQKEALAARRSGGAVAFNFGPRKRNYYIISENMFNLFISLLEEQKQ